MLTVPPSDEKSGSRATGEVPDTLSFFSRVRRTLADSAFVRSVAVLAGGTILGQGLLIAVSPLLTRLYSPEDFGQFGVYMSFVLTTSVVMSLRYETAALNVGSLADARQIAGLALRLVVPMSAAGAVVLAVLIRTSSLGFSSLPGYASLLGWVAMAATGVALVARYWFLRDSRVKLIAQLTVAQNGGRALAQLGLGFLGGGFFGLALGDLMGRLAAMVRGFVVARKEIRRLGVFDWPRARMLARRFRDFATFLTPSTLVNSLAGIVGVPLISLYYGAESAGQFFLVTRVLALPASLVGGAVADSFHGRLAEKVRGGDQGVPRFVNRTARAMLGIGAIPTAMIMVLAPSVFPILFGAEWSDAGLLAAVLAPRFLAGFVVSPISRAVLVLDGQRLKLLYDAFALVGTIGAIALAEAAGFGLVGAGVALSVVGVLAYGMYYAIVMRVVTRDRVGTDGGPG